MKDSGIAVALVFAILTFGLWAYMNRPAAEPPWPARVQGMAFSPFHADQDPAYRRLPDRTQIEADLQLLSGKVAALRIYSSLYSLAEVPQLAAHHGIKITVGAWLDTRRHSNEAEIHGAIRLAQDNDNVTHVIVGNEVLHRGDLTLAELVQHIDRVREAVQQPVSTAEPAHVWLRNPELAQHVDFVTVHLLPYWEGIGVEQANDFIAGTMRQLQAAFPDKLIVIGEVGWPSDGRTRGQAIASVSHEALFLRRFLRLARDAGYVYYLMEAFDQPWKARFEGAVGAYWGVYDVHRRPKFEFVAPIVRVQRWQLLAVISVALAALLLGQLYMHSTALRIRGRGLLAMVVYAAATAAVWIIYDYSQRYLSFGGIIIGALLILCMLAVIALLLTEAHEWAEAHWATTRRRRFTVSSVPSRHWPKVSIHVPAYNEPVPMLIETLNALAALDYPDFEVILVDNNTADEAVWRPLEAHCRLLGPRFRFFHAAPLAGFKAGALNYALRRTAADADIIAVIDSDYRVDTRWLCDLVPGFDDPKVAIVQAPQDYRDSGASLFKAMCYAEYRGFFHIGMVTRNERNAIIQHGTMTLVRRAALEQADGWAQWCITEDAELGLRLFALGHEACYLVHSYGRGLMPDSFADYRKQRFRWAYGAVQILRIHAAALFSGTRSRLTRGQRYHFIAGWLPWLADGLNLIFTLAALCWSAAMILWPNRIDPPPIMFSALPLVLFTFKLLKLAHLYTSRIGTNVRQTFAAAMAGLSLSHTIGKAVIKALFTRDEPFFRTPKHGTRHVLARAVTDARQEMLILAALLLAVLGLTHRFAIAPGLVIGLPRELKGTDVSVWIAVLLIQAVPYAAALLMSIIDALPLPAKWLGDPARPLPDLRPDP
ncbi:beta-(1-3)-glucosyl transferase [Steroidobacter denitrificans]|uniref:Beta-monoglucosyldiacylglycerol synthase n=1 Tax=Steroidobacter denitrificans TaxID=465721 RepID=A0A127FBW1_STEDE|nr:glycosyltransferase [Steroidobacter denitrificans]AMN47896.1 beta-(1-3)-glucosyl transferase [Steroidobacter denitrificans]